MVMTYLISMTNFIPINVLNLQHLIKQICHYKEEMKYMEINMQILLVLIIAYIKNLMLMKIKFIVVVF